MCAVFILHQYLVELSCVQLNLVDASLYNETITPHSPSKQLFRVMVIWYALAKGFLNEFRRFIDCTDTFISEPAI